nr:MACPF domain-containing protein At4g24290-like [Ipomoea batatas]
MYEFPAASGEDARKPTAVRAMEALGCGFDFASDFRLKFVKKSPAGSRLVILDERNRRDLVLPGGGVTIPDVSENIRCDKGDHIRFKSDVLEFNQMSEVLNQKSSVQGKVPSGYLNAIFDLSGSWLNDASDAKYLAFDGYFVSLYYLHLTASPLLLQDQVKKDVPPHWDPASLSRFIQTYGTHIIVGMGIGGQDLLCVKQRPSSTIPPAELKGYLDDLGDCLFSDGTSPLPERNRRDGKKKVPEVFSRMLQSHTMQFTSITETSSKDGLTIIWSKRGGDVFAQSHLKWLQTLTGNSEGILFKLVPITSLLAGIPGSGYLSHAINLYLRFFPSDLQFFDTCSMARHQKDSTRRGLQDGVRSSLQEQKPIVSINKIDSSYGKRPSGVANKSQGTHLQQPVSSPGRRIASTNSSVTGRVMCEYNPSHESVVNNLGHLNAVRSLCLEFSP